MSLLADEPRSDELPLAHEHPVCHQRRPAADRTCQLCSQLSVGETQGFFCCLAACDFYMCRSCAVSGSHRVNTSKHKHGLVKTVHDELWHCDLCQKTMQTSVVVAAATAATADAASNLPTAKPAVLTKMLASAKAVIVSDATAVPAGMLPAYHCSAGCDFDMCEDCYANPSLLMRKGGKPQRAAAEARQGRQQIGGISVVCWVATACRLLPALAREPAASAAQLAGMSALLAAILLTLHRLTTYDASRHEPKAAGDPQRRGDWYCERCQMWRAARTYHCGTCGECTEGVDPCHTRRPYGGPPGTPSAPLRPPRAAAAGPAGHAGYEASDGHPEALAGRAPAELWQDSAVPCVLYM